MMQTLTRTQHANCLLARSVTFASIGARVMPYLISVKDGFNFLSCRCKAAEAANLCHCERDEGGQQKREAEKRRHRLNARLKPVQYFLQKLIICLHLWQLQSLVHKSSEKVVAVATGVLLELVSAKLRTATVCEPESVGCSIVSRQTRR